LRHAGLQALSLCFHGDGGRRGRIGRRVSNAGVEKGRSRTGGGTSEEAVEAEGVA